MNVLVVGSGAREHALFRAVRPTRRWATLVPPATSASRRTGARPVDDDPAPEVVALAHRQAWTWSSSVRRCRWSPVSRTPSGRGIACFGPGGRGADRGQQGVREGGHGGREVPTALPRVVRDRGEAAAALDAFGPPYVVKDDGLAAGKGVVVTDDRGRARAHAAAGLDRPANSWSRSSSTVRRCRCPASRDGAPSAARRARRTSSESQDGDAGPNTGGMGAYTPAALGAARPRPTRSSAGRAAGDRELARRCTPFAGLLYCRARADRARGVRVVEFNARFGDPETQVVLARLPTPLGGLLHAAATGSLRPGRRPALAERRGRHGGRRRRELPGGPSHRRRGRRPRRGGRRRGG